MAHTAYGYVGAASAQVGGTGPFNTDVTLTGTLNDGGYMYAMGSISASTNSGLSYNEANGWVHLTTPHHFTSTSMFVFMGKPIGPGESLTQTLETTDTVTRSASISIIAFDDIDSADPLHDFTLVNNSTDTAVETNPATSASGTTQAYATLTTSISAYVVEYMRRTANLAMGTTHSNAAEFDEVGTGGVSGGRYSLWASTNAVAAGAKADTISVQSGTDIRVKLTFAPNPYVAPPATSSAALLMGL